MGLRFTGKMPVSRRKSGTGFQPVSRICAADLAVAFCEKVHWPQAGPESFRGSSLSHFTAVAPAISAGTKA
jgi:hypothetical protein